MLKKEKLLLKALIENYKVGDHVDTRDIYSNIKLSAAEVDSICDSLYKKGIISDKYSNYANGGRGFKFSHSILEYCNDRKHETLRFVVNNVVIPIIVGVVSSIITSVILGLMS